MSGLAVISHDDGRPVDLRLLRRMLEALRHRGPDGLSHWADGPIGLGHALMQSTPESLREHQPRSDGQCWIVWDGRLDNREELLRTLRAEGVPLGEETDPALMLGAHRLWGQCCVEHILGEFAFVLWDQRTRTLVGARDRVGLKPFYYTQQGTALLIASEAKAILAALDHRPEPDDEMVLAMLLSELREPDNHRSLFAGIHRLPPGHVMVVRDGQIHISRYWQLDPSRQIVYKQPQAYVEHFRALFEEAVNCRTRSAFPVGCLLSGGLDSSAVTAVAAMHGATVEAFTAFSEDPRSDERVYAREVCETAGIRHWEFTGRSADPLEGVDEVLWNLECPLISTDRNGPWLSELIRSRQCRVVLDGEGGDELIDEDGYLAEWLRRNPVRFLREARAFARWRGESLTELVNGTCKDVLPPPLKKWGKRLLRPVPDWFNQELARRARLRARICSPRVPVRFPSVYQTATYEGAFSPYFLLKLEMEEREAAHAGREVWHPFLDSRLIEFLFAIPWPMRCQDGQRKWLLRQATRGVLPEAVRLRRGKGDWTAGMDAALLALCRRDPPEPLANRSGMLTRYVNPAGARRLVERYRWGAQDVRWQVWALVAVDRWLKRFWNEGGCTHAGEIISQEAVQQAELAPLR